MVSELLDRRCRDEECNSPLVGLRNHFTPRARPCGENLEAALELAVRERDLHPRILPWAECRIHVKPRLAWAGHACPYLVR